MEKLPFQIELTPGRGSLEMRALWAGIVGPHRLAMGSRSSVELSTQQSTLLFKNKGASDACIFIGVALPAGSATVALRILVSDGGSQGSNTDAPFNLTQTMGGGSFSSVGFMQLLLPGEELYGQISDPTFGGTTQRVVVSAAVF